MRAGVLSARDYDLAYHEFVGVHGEVNWEVEFAAGLRWPVWKSPQALFSEARKGDRSASLPR